MTAARTSRQNRQKARQKRQSNKSNSTSANGRQGGRTSTYGARAARPYVAALLAVLLVLLIMFAALGGGGGGSSPSGGDGDAVEPLPSGHPALALARGEAGDPLALGAVDAPVVMIEYADFQDAFVGIHARKRHDRLVSEYVDAGLLRIEFRNYPINGPESDAAARAAWAAGQQGRFWEFHDAALGERFNQGSGRFDTDGLRALAREAGVPDVERFLRELDAKRAGEAVGRDAEEGYELGVTSVPAFLINGHPVDGAQPLDVFRDTIDPLLEAAGDG